MTNEKILEMLKSEDYELQRLGLVLTGRNLESDLYKRDWFHEFAVRNAINQLLKKKYNIHL